MGFIPDNSNVTNNTSIDNRLTGMGLNPAQLTPEVGQSIMGVGDIGLQQAVMEKLGWSPQQAFGGNQDIVGQFLNKLNGGVGAYNSGPGPSQSQQMFGGAAPNLDLNQLVSLLSQQPPRQPQFQPPPQSQQPPPTRQQSTQPQVPNWLRQFQQQPRQQMQPQSSMDGGIVDARPFMGQNQFGGRQLGPGTPNLFQQPRTNTAFRTPGVEYSSNGRSQQPGGLSSMSIASTAGSRTQQQTIGGDTGELSPETPGMGGYEDLINQFGTQQPPPQPGQQPTAGGQPPSGPYRPGAPGNEWMSGYGVGKPGGGIELDKLPEGMSQWLTNNYLNRAFAPEQAGMLSSYFQNQGFAPQQTPFDNGAGQIQYAQDLFNQTTQPSLQWAQALMQGGLPNVNDQYNQSRMDQSGANVLQGGRGVYGAQDAFQQLLGQGFVGQGNLQDSIAQQLGFAGQQQGNAGQIINNLMQGQGMFTGQLQQLGNRLFNEYGTGAIPSERVGAGVSQVYPQNVQAGQTATMLVNAPDFQGPQQTFNQIQQQASSINPQQVNTPNFYSDLINKAFGAGGNLQTPLTGAAYTAGPQQVQAPQVSMPGQSAPGSIQGTTSNALEGMIAGGGISPQYVQAMRERVLKPSNEALMGRLNQQGGGQASVDSGLFQELQRRQEADFNNDLVIAGMNNLGQFTGQGAAMGQQQFGQGLANQQLNQQAQQFNAGQGMQAQLANQGAGQQGGQFNAQLQQQSMLANQAAQQQTQQLGVQAGLQGLGLLPQIGGQMLGAQQSNQQAGLQGQGMSLDALQGLAGMQGQNLQFGAGQQLQAGLANQGAYNQTGQFNINAALQAMLANQQAGLQGGSQNQNAQLQAALANQQNTRLTGQSTQDMAFRQFQQLQDLQNQMQNQYMQTAGTAGQLGSNAFQNSLGAFQGTGGLGLDAITRAGQQGNIMSQLGLDRWGQANQQSLVAGQLANSIMGQGGQFAAGMINPMLQGQNQTWGAQNQQVQNMLQFLNQQNQTGLGQAGLATDLAIERNRGNTAADIARLTGIGGGIQGLLAALFGQGGGGQGGSGGSGNIDWKTIFGGGQPGATPPLVPPGGGG